MLPSNQYPDPLTTAQRFVPVHLWFMRRVVHVAIHTKARIQQGYLTTAVAI